MRWKLGVAVVCDLDEVVVGVSEVDGSDRTDGSSARDRTFQDGHAAQTKVIDDLAERRGCNQADVSRTWSGRECLGLELLALLMEIDLLLRETQSISSSGKRDDFHAEYLLVEAAGRFNVGDCQDDVVKAEDLHSGMKSGRDGDEQPNTSRGQGGGCDCGSGRRLCERGVPMGEGCVSGLNQPG